MKTLTILTFSAFTLIAAQSAEACMISPKGDSQLRVKALHETIDNNEQLTGLRLVAQDLYEIQVSNFSSDEGETRVIKLQNTSPMCPKYKATRIK